MHRMNIDLQDRFHWARSRISYRPARWSLERWEQTYRSRSRAYFEDIDEVARYAMTAGYVPLRSSGPPVLDVGCDAGCDAGWFEVGG